MEQESCEILLPGEIEHYIEYLKPTELDELGTESWVQMHQCLQKLGQQAVLEASEYREESVKDALITFNKLKVIVYEIICISVWREKIFPELLQLEENPSDTLIASMVLFHEATAITVLETVLYHADSCENLDDTALDLLDYCIAAILRLTSGIPYSGDSKGVDDISKPTGEVLRNEESVLAFSIGIRCISILRYLAEYIDCVPLSITPRMYSHHDVPLLLVHLLETRPWEKKDAKNPKRKLIFSDGQWTQPVGEECLKLTRTEGQVWIALRQLLLDQRCTVHYEMSDFRRNQLQKIQRYLTDPLLDQMAVLIELKQYVCHLQISSNQASSRKPVILEVLPEIRDKILESGSRRWKKLARKQAKILFHVDRETLCRMAKGLSDVYNLDILEKMSNKSKSSQSCKCAKCGDSASKRCSQCKNIWYCGRECQVKDWSKHKIFCNNKAAKSEDDGQQSSSTVKIDSI